MTNIGAMKILERDADNIAREQLLFVADGMGSSESYKNDNYQKLFRINDCLVMGTGSGDYILNTVMTLLTANYSSAKDVAEKIREITAGIPLRDRAAVNFIVGGKDPEGMSLYHIKNMNYPEISQGPCILSRSFKKKDFFIFDGCGSELVDRYLDGNNIAGKPLRANDLADALVLMYEFGKNGAISNGVNDKLQYGFIDDKGVSTAYHPDIRLLTDDIFRNYLSSMTGIDVPPFTADLEKNNHVSSKRNDLARILRNFYSSMEHDLRDYSESRLQYTRGADMYGDDIIPVEILNMTKAEKQNAKADVAKAAKALANRGLESLLGYTHDFDRRQSEIEDRARGYLQK